MRFRQGIQAEVVLSLALLMVTGTSLLAAFFLEIHSARIDGLHGLLGRGFAAATAEAGFERSPPEPGAWWRLDEAGRVVGLNAPVDALDPETRRLGEEALATGRPVVTSGAPWAPIRFAGPRRHGRGVVMGRIDAPVSGLVLATLLVSDVLIFALFGVSLLRRRIVGPLHRLATHVRQIGEGDLPVAVAVEGVAEIESLAVAFNEMQTALAARTGALEKAVADLREANATLVQAREGLDRAERLALVGSLAAGVAHEVGNPMAAMLAFLDVAARDEGLGEEGRRCLSRASEQGERVRVILRQLLDFSRPPQIRHVPIDLEPIARQAIELVSAQRVYADIEFAVRVEGRSPVGPAIGDASLAVQILLNLVLNAAAALEGASERRIHITIVRDRRRRRAGDAAGDDAIDRSDSVVCRVEDSGPGVRLEDPERIFDPFFTTKAPGEGTGLGLANARRLAEEMGGTIELAREGSQLGGACLRFVLRRAVSPSDTAAGVRESCERAAADDDGEGAPISPVDRSP